ncbi:HIG1 domain family member 1C-like isoform X2 [Chiloscyllium punctatum]|uniref:HIG1 domain family member 1C-like isoform X2 n=1 Tax=Chiloscyllium punctatum TaxID=137246 RepID=UPI003B635BCC
MSSLNNSWSSSPDETESSKLLRKSKESPFIPFGIAGCLAIVALGFHKLRKTKQKMSLYLIHMRVAAQGFLVGVMTLVAGKDARRHGTLGKPSKGYNNG